MSTNHYKDNSKLYVGIFLFLVGLTGLTVWTAGHNYGEWNLVVAMVIASVKATVVALFFMHLKHDNWVNRITFISALLFLAIFVGLSATDQLVRQPATPVKIQAVQAAPASADQLKQFLQSTPELVELGSKTFQANCTTCHGPKGLGDGPAAAALNPKPRNFSTGYWKAGGGVAQVYNTISKGLAGSPMPGFSTLSNKERFALAHYVRSLSPNKPDDTPEGLAVIGITSGTSTSTAPKEKPELPVDFVIQRMLKETH